MRKTHNNFCMIIHTQLHFTWILMLLGFLSSHQYAQVWIKNKKYHAEDYNCIIDTKIYKSHDVWLIECWEDNAYRWRLYTLWTCHYMTHIISVESIRECYYCDSTMDTASGRACLEDKPKKSDLLRLKVPNTSECYKCYKQGMTSRPTCSVH